MARPPKAKQVIRVALILGFMWARQRGSHAIYRHGDGRRITVPIHAGKDISPGVFKQIIKDLQITQKEFWNF